LKNIVKIGGARIGMMNATWPFAKLVVDTNELRLYSMLHRISFKKADIIKISVVSYVPFIAQGIKFEHVVPKYNKHIVFWCLNNPKQLIQQLNELGWNV
jgi:hypothetical protein